MAEDKKRKRVEDSSTAQKKKKKSVARATQQDLTVKLASVLTPRVSPPIIGELLPAALLLTLRVESVLTF
jgi:hypothetical protein